jgi:hypothetical protein
MSTLDRLYRIDRSLDTVFHSMPGVATGMSSGQRNPGSFLGVALSEEKAVAVKASMTMYHKNVTELAVVFDQYIKSIKDREGVMYMRQGIGMMLKDGIINMYQCIAIMKYNFKDVICPVMRVKKEFTRPSGFKYYYAIEHINRSWLSHQLAIVGEQPEKFKNYRTGTVLKDDSSATMQDILRRLDDIHTSFQLIKTELVNLSRDDSQDEPREDDEYDLFEADWPRGA